MASSVSKRERRKTVKPIKKRFKNYRRMACILHAYPHSVNSMINHKYVQLIARFNYTGAYITRISLYVIIESQNQLIVTKDAVIWTGT